MPITKSAKKALRRDQRRTKTNLKIKKSLKLTLKSFRSKPSQAGLTKSFQELDRAAKKKYITPNKSSRLKSRLSHLLTKTTPKKSPKKSKA